MSKSEQVKVNFSSKKTHRGLQKSTTLNRRYVRRPTKLTITDGSEKSEAKAPKKAAVSEKAKSPSVIKKHTKEVSLAERANAELVAMLPKISHIYAEKPAKKITEVKKVSKAKETPDLPPAPNPYQAALDARKAEKEERVLRDVSSRALKDAAIARAVARADKNAGIAEKVMLNEMAADKKAAKSDKKASRKARKETKHLKKHRGKRIFLAFMASAACMIALATLVKVNLPSISVKVAALQTGVEATYPSYIPRDFSISDVYTDGSTVIINFKGPDNASFALYEEKSSWSSSSLLSNYVKGAYGSNYEVVREQGITIYVNSSNAAWVNKGIFYRISATSGTLSKKQIKDIVTSL